LALPGNNAADKEGKGRCHVVGVYVKWCSVAAAGKLIKVIFSDQLHGGYRMEGTSITDCKSDVAAWEKQEKKMEGEVVHIAVGKNTRKEEPNIRWAAAAFPEAAIVLVHVHWPSEWMPFSKIYLLCLFSSLGSCSCSLSWLVCEHQFLI
jgi:hypothetical protein